LLNETRTFTGSKEIATKRTTLALAGLLVAPRDAASGMASGKRQHRPMVFLVDWSTGRVQGGFASPSAAQEAAQRLRESPSRACAVSIDADSQPGTIEVQSWSWGETQPGTYSSTR